MQILTKRDLSQVRDDELQVHWNWSQAQLQRIRPAFGTLSIGETTGSSESVFQRTVSYVSVAVRQVILGLALPVIGARYIWRRKGLLKWAMSPIFVAAAVAAVVMIGLALTVGASAASLAAAWSHLNGWAAGAGMAALGVVGAFVVVVLVVAGGLVLSYGLLALCGPFLEFLAEAAEDSEAEVLWTDWSAPRFSFGVLVKNLIITATSWVFFSLVVSIVAVSATAIPVIGWIVGPLMLLAAQGWIYTGEYICTVRLWTIRDKLTFIRSYPWLFIGCGFLVSTLVVLVPFVALPALVPCSVVGFTLVLVWLQHEGLPMPADRRVGDGPRRLEIV